MFGMVLLAVCLSLDAFAVSMAYGLRATRIPLSSRLVICACSMAYFGVAFAFGNWIQNILPPGASSIIGTILMGGVCLWMLFQSFFSRPSKEKPQSLDPKTLVHFRIKSLGISVEIIKNPMLCDVDGSKTISPLEALLLGTALSVDSVSVGIGYALLGVEGLWGTLWVGLFQFAFTWIGNALGLKMGLRFPHSDKLQVISALVILALLIYRIVAG